MAISTEEAQQKFNDLDALIDEINRKYPIDKTTLLAFNSAKTTFEQTSKIPNSAQFKQIYITVLNSLIRHAQQAKKIDPNWEIDDSLFKQLRRDEDPLERIIKIKDCFLTFTNNASPALPEVTTSSSSSSQIASISSGKTRSSPKKKARSRQIDIEEADQPPVTPTVITYSEEINELFLNFSRLAESIQSQEISQIDFLKDDLPLDVPLVTMIREYEKTHLENLSCVKRIKQVMREEITRLDNREKLQTTILPEGINTLTTNLARLQTLENNILTRRKLLSPQTDEQKQLHQLQQKAYEDLQQSLIRFASNFSGITVTTKINGEPLEYVNELAKFIGEIDYYLSERSLSVNSNAKQELITALTDHLGKGKQFLILESERKLISPTEIIETVKGIFVRESSWYSRFFELTSNDIKQQIADAYILQGRIDNFPLSTILDHDILQTKTMLIDKQLQTEFIEKTEDGKNALILSRLLGFLSDNTSTYLEENRDLLKRYNDLTSKLSDNLANYHVFQKTFQETDIAKLTQHIKLQNDYLNTSKNIQKELDECHEQIQKAVNQLQGTYHHEKQNSIKTLETAIKNTRGVCRCADVSEDDVDQILDQALALHESIMSDKNIPVSKNVNTTCAQLESIINEKMSIVADKLRLKVEAVQNSAKSAFKIDKDNPFKTDWEKALADTNSASGRLENAYKNLDQIPGMDLPTWIDDTFEGHITTLKSEIACKNTIELKANIIERRLQNAVYIASKSALLTMEEEYITLIDKKIASLPAENSDDLKLKYQRMKTLLVVSEDQINENQDIIALIEADPTLYAIWCLHAQFIQINQEYIDKDYNQCSDERYLAKLVDQVKNTINSLEQVPAEKKNTGVIHWFLQLLSKLFCCGFGTEEKPNRYKFYSTREPEEQNILSKFYAISDELSEVKTEQQPTVDEESTTPKVDRYKNSIFRRSTKIQAEALAQLTNQKGC